MSQKITSEEVDLLLDALYSDGITIEKLLDLRSGVLGNNQDCYNELMKLASMYGHTIRNKQ